MEDDDLALGNSYFESRGLVSPVPRWLTLIYDNKTTRKQCSISLARLGLMKYDPTLLNVDYWDILRMLGTRQDCRNFRTALVKGLKQQEIEPTVYIWKITAIGETLSPLQDMGHVAETIGHPPRPSCNENRLSRAGSKLGNTEKEQLRFEKVDQILHPLHRKCYGKIRSRTKKQGGT